MAEQPQGTEYTLQGVMRFLQMEWHNHERARNAWDIERAEMKAKIAKQEGQTRSAKRLNEALDKQIRMLERALRAERAKNKVLMTGEKDAAALEKAVKEAEALARPEMKGSSKLQELLKATPIDPRIALEPEYEVRADKAKQFAQKSLEELTYLLTPPSFPPPSEPLPMQNALYGGHDSRMTAESMYAVQQRREQMALSQLPTMPNHQPDRLNMSMDNFARNDQRGGLQDVPLMADERSMSAPQMVPLGLQRDGTAASPTEEVEQVIYTVDASDQQIRERDNHDIQQTIVSTDNDEWNFDDNEPSTIPASDPAPPRRPDTEMFPPANPAPIRSPPRQNRRRSSGSVSMSRRRSEGPQQDGKPEAPTFKVRFALRGHLDVVRSVIFTGGGSPSEPEICTTGDDGMVKRWIIPSSYSNFPYSPPQQQASHTDLDIQSYFTHRGHEGMVTCLAASPPFTSSFSTGGRALGDGWVFSGGQDASILVWERGRVDPKARLEGHTDAIWSLCVLPALASAVFGSNPNIPSSDRILLVSGSADHTLKIWAVSAPPQLTSPQNSAAGGRRGVGGTRRHSLSSGSGFPSSPQPSTASGSPFHYTLIHSITLPHNSTATPTSIAPLGADGESFVVSYDDATILVFDTRTGDEIVSMQSSETYDGTPATGINAVVAMSTDHDRGTGGGSDGEDDVGAPTGREGGVEGVVISGHEDRFIRFFDANSGQNTYTYLAHPSSIASLCLSPSGTELVSAGHDASLRVWSLETRSCVQEISSHRLMRGEGVVSVCWSPDGRWIVSAGGDGVVKVFSR